MQQETEGCVERLKILASNSLRQWPGLPYLSLGCLYSWLQLMFASMMWLTEDASLPTMDLDPLSYDLTNPVAIMGLAAIFYCSCAVTLLLSALLRRRLERVRKRHAAWTGAALASLGVLLVIISGPYYFFGLSALQAPAIGIVLCGVGIALLTLACGRLYCKLAPRLALLYCGQSVLTSALIYFVVVGMGSWPTFGGDGPSFTTMVFLVALPFAAAALARLPVSSPPAAAAGANAAGAGVSAASAPAAAPSPTGASASAGKAAAGALGEAAAAAAAMEAANGHSRPQRAHGAGGAAARAKGERNGRLVPSFWKLVATFFVLALITQAFHTAIVIDMDTASLLSGGGLRMFANIGVAAVLLGVALLIPTQNMNFGKAYSLLIFFVVVLLSLTPFLNAQTARWEPLLATLTDVFDYLLWLLVSFYGHQKRARSIAVYGFAYGASMLGSAAGWLTGYAIDQMSLLQTSGTALSLAGSISVLTLFFVVFSERELFRMFAPQKDEKPLAELFDKRIETVGAPQQEEGIDAALSVLQRRYRLSQREVEVLGYLARGRSDKYTASQMHISLNTVRAHTRNAYAKLDVHSRDELHDLIDHAV